MSVEKTFYRANCRFHLRNYTRWRQLQSKTQILRSQVGFAETASTCPTLCQGCLNYHGLSYGTRQATRTLLVCAIHPYGWQQGVPCPDWCD